MRENQRVRNKSLIPLRCKLHARVSLRAIRAFMAESTVSDRHSSDFTASYDTTVIHTGGQKNDEIKLPRSYIRVDREMLKARFIEQCEQKGVSLIERLVKSSSNSQHNGSPSTDTPSSGR